MDLTTLLLKDSFSCKMEPRSIVPKTIIFPHVLFAIFGPELSSI